MADKDKVLDDDDFIDLPDGVMKLDVEPEIDEETRVPFKLFDDDDEEPAAKKSAGNDDGDDAAEEDEEGEDQGDDERAALAAQNADLQRQLDEVTTSLSSERTQSRKHVSSAVAVALEGVNAREELLAEKLKQAREEGKTGDEIAVQRQITELGTIRTTLEKVKTEAEREPEKPASRESRPADSGSVKPKNQLASRWQSQNAAWLNDPKHRPKVAYLTELDRQLAAEGNDPNSDDYFKELTKRMKKTFPDLGVRHVDGKPPATGQRQRGGSKGSPVAAAKQTAGADKPNGNRVKITGDDLRMMRRLRLDTSNKDVLKAYARNKASKSPYMV